MAGRIDAIELLGSVERDEENIWLGIGEDRERCWRGLFAK